ncbi:NAD-P-binding protein [Dentipellis sp. KUC8613]|nr:NAD-P-binding protein [Dentipellis sp. KUC8613]
MSNNAQLTAKSLFNVEDWVCVVSGGGTGIGLMITQAYANNGARVYILGRREDVLKKTAETYGAKLANPRGKIIPVVCDITDKASLGQAVQTVRQSEDHVDVLVNNSGVTRGESDFSKGDQDATALARELWNEKQSDWEDVYRTNVIGHFFTAVAFLPLLAQTANFQAGHTGCVINVTSVAGISGDSLGHISYNVSKGAAIQLSNTLAQEFRRQAVQVRVNNIAPGYFPTEMLTQESDERNKSRIADPDFGRKFGIPAGRAGCDKDMAQAALLLACNEYAYGETLIIDGGFLLEHP